MDHSYQCWFDEKERVISFHNVEGYRQQTFSCGDAFWMFVRSKIKLGFRVQ